MSKNCKQPRRSKEFRRPRQPARWFLVGTVLAVASATTFAYFARWSSAKQPVTAPSVGASLDSASDFFPTIANQVSPSRRAPQGMVWIPGGEFSMGAMDPPASTEAGMHGAVDARPIHRVYVDGFWMDPTDITNEQFAKFVRATGYVTVAERKPR